MNVQQARSIARIRGRLRRLFMGGQLGDEVAAEAETVLSEFRTAARLDIAGDLMAEYRRWRTRFDLMQQMLGHSDQNSSQSVAASN